LWSYLKGSGRITSEILAPAKKSILQNVNKTKQEKPTEKLSQRHREKIKVDV